MRFPSVPTSCASTTPAARPTAPLGATASCNHCWGACSRPPTARPWSRRGPCASCFRPAATPRLRSWRAPWPMPRSRSAPRPAGRAARRCACARPAESRPPCSPRRPTSWRAAAWTPPCRGARRSRRPVSAGRSWRSRSSPGVPGPARRRPPISRSARSRACRSVRPGRSTPPGAETARPTTPASRPTCARQARCWTRRCRRSGAMTRTRRSRCWRSACAAWAAWTRRTAPGSWPPSPARGASRPPAPRRGSRWQVRWSCSRASRCRRVRGRTPRKARRRMPRASPPCCSRAWPTPPSARRARARCSCCATWRRARIRCVPPRTPRRCSWRGWGLRRAATRWRPRAAASSGRCRARATRWCASAC